MTIIPTDPGLLRAAVEAQRASGRQPVVNFKHEDDGPSGPAWIDAADGTALPLATTHWDADATGSSGSASAWYTLAEVRRYARRVGATVEEW